MLNWSIHSNPDLRLHEVCIKSISLTRSLGLGEPLRMKDARVREPQFGFVRLSLLDLAPSCDFGRLLSRGLGSALMNPVVLASLGPLLILHRKTATQAKDIT